MDDRTEGLTERTAAEMAGGDAPDARTRELRAEIDHTRAELSETVDAIQERLRPGNIVADATESVKHATTEKVRSMRNVAENRAEQIAEAGRQNWMPAALIGIGTAWLLMNRSGGGRNREFYYGGKGRGYQPVGTRGYSEHTDEENRVAALSGRVGESASEYAEQAREYVSQAGEYASETGERVRRSTRRAGNQLQRLLNENPLLVGAAAVVVGAAVGMAIPETERENEWMGDTRERVVDRAQEMARGAADKVKNATTDAVANTITGGGD